MQVERDWQTPTGEQPNLTEIDVHIWRIELRQPEYVVAQLRTSLSDDELRRADRFNFEKHRRRFVVGRAALRDILQRYMGIKAAEIAFEYETHGKPALLENQNRKNIRFNLSHTEELAICAVARGRAVGIDVEFRQRKLVDFDKIAKRFFSPIESEAYLKLPETQKPEAFFTCWTRKEAFIKAIGEGLTHPLHRFDVSFLPADPPALLNTRPDPAEAPKWSLYAFTPAEDYIGALIVEGKGLNLAYWQW